jgi:hypothetical protein
MIRYKISPPTTEQRATMLLKNGSGETDDLEVLDRLVELLNEQEADAVFELPSGKELTLEQVTRLRDEVACDLRLV